jgi:hypothetical protein
MDSSQSSSEQFSQHLESVGGSEDDTNDATYLVTDADTVESIVSGLRIQQQQDGSAASEASILHASAQVLISKRDEQDADHHVDSSQPGQYQLDMHFGGSHRTREPIPEQDLEAARVWARGRIEAPPVAAPHLERVHWNAVTTTTRAGTSSGPR